MKKSPVYDLPTRLFHWFFVLLFYWSFFVAREVDSKTILYSTHMLSGLIVLLIVIVRIFLGFFGSYYSKFGHLSLAPRDLILYFKTITQEQSIKIYGHNPASSWVLISVLCLSLVITFSGISMALEVGPEWFEEIHAWSGNLLFFISVFHIFGVAIHSFRHKDELWKSIIGGKKMTIENLAPEVFNEKRSVLSGISFIFLIVFYALFLYSNFNPETRMLKVGPTELNLGD